MLKFKVSEVSVEVPISYFFLSLGDFSKGVNLIVLEQLDTQDIFKFIELNNDRKAITNSKNKDIDFKSHIYELKEYDSLSETGSFTLHFVFKP